MVQTYDMTDAGHPYFISVFGGNIRRLMGEVKQFRKNSKRVLFAINMGFKNKDCVNMIEKLNYLLAYKFLKLFVILGGDDDEEVARGLNLSNIIVPEDYSIVKCKAGNILCIHGGAPVCWYEPSDNFIRPTMRDDKLSEIMSTTIVNAVIGGAELTEHYGTICVSDSIYCDALKQISTNIEACSTIMKIITQLVIKQNMMCACYIGLGRNLKNSGWETHTIDLNVVLPGINEFTPLCFFKRSLLWKEARYSQ